MPMTHLSTIYRDMNNGVYNNCKNGQCSKCGECCTDALPMSEKEIRVLRAYVKRKGIKPHKMIIPTSGQQFNLICPLLDENHRCMAYEVRPEICRSFQCNMPPKAIDENKKRQFNSGRMTRSVWADVFGDESQGMKALMKMVVKEAFQVHS